MKAIRKVRIRVRLLSGDGTTVNSRTWRGMNRVPDGTDEARHCTWSDRGAVPRPWPSFTINRTRLDGVALARVLQTHVKSTVLVMATFQRVKNDGVRPVPPSEPDSAEPDHSSVRGAAFPIQKAWVGSHPTPTVPHPGIASIQHSQPASPIDPAF
jgi:hypothetical protein